MIGAEAASKFVRIRVLPTPHETDALLTGDPGGPNRIIHQDNIGPVTSTGRINDTRLNNQQPIVINPTKHTRKDTTVKQKRPADCGVKGIGARPSQTARKNLLATAKKPQFELHDVFKRSLTDRYQGHRGRYAAALSEPVTQRGYQVLQGVQIGHIMRKFGTELKAPVPPVLGIVEITLKCVPGRE